MAKRYSLNQQNATFASKVTKTSDGADLDHTLIADQFMVFYKPKGTRFEKQANLEVDDINPSQIIALSAIVGDGIEDVITVTIANTGLLKEGELVTISATTNFNVSKKPITILDATKFTYKLGSVGNVSSEATGNVTTQGEKKVVYQNTDPEESILDEIGKWERAVRMVLTNGDDVETVDRALFWVS